MGKNGAPVGVEDSKFHRAPEEVQFLSFLRLEALNNAHVKIFKF